MAPDDEVLFGHSRDESITSFERIERLAHQASGHESPEFAIAMAEFDLHGATLRTLVRWYPDEARIRGALIEWELRNARLPSQVPAQS